MIKLYHGDCLKLMPKIPSKSIDMILADLPYGITRAKWDSTIPLKPLWKQYKRIIKDHGCIALFGAEPFTSNLIMSNTKMFRYNWIWYKTMSTGFLNVHRMPLNTYENISIFYKHLPTYNPQMRKGKIHTSNPCGTKSSLWGKYTSLKHNKITNKYYPTNIIKFSNADRTDRYHPTQKPTDLLRYLIKTYTNKNDLVLDNVMGSGSTGVACKQLNRNFIGIELDKHYYHVAQKRITSIL